MYEQQTPFELIDYVGLSSFLNNFLYKSIQENIFGELAIDWTIFIVQLAINWPFSIWQI